MLSYLGKDIIKYIKSHNQIELRQLINSGSIGAYKKVSKTSLTKEELVIVTIDLIMLNPNLFKTYIIIRLAGQKNRLKDLNDRMAVTDQQIRHAFDAHLEDANKKIKLYENLSNELKSLGI